MPGKKKIETYSARIYCRNCNIGGIKVTNDGEYFSQDNVIAIAKGTLVKDAECPNCGCKSLSLIKE